MGGVLLYQSSRQMQRLVRTDGLERRTSKLSTEIGRKAWRQAGRKRRTKGTQGTGEHRGNRRQGKSGRGERKAGRLSSQNPKLKRPKGCEKQRGSESGKEAVQTVEWTAQRGWK